MNYGFVASLPRSGSAWIANYLTWGKSFFVHDPWKSCTPSTLKKKFDTIKDIEMCGSADSGNVLLLDQIDKEFPESKWVLITRPVAEVKASCENIKFPFVDFTEHLTRLCKTREVLKVPFREMFDRADEIGRWIDDDWACPAWRKSELKDLNVQLNWGRVSDQFKVPAIMQQADALTPNKIRYYRLIQEIVNNEPHAIRFLHQARNASELYRRLNEGKAIDVKVTKETLEAMAIEWISSPFVKNFSDSLVPAIVSALEKYQNQKDLEHCPIDVDLLTVVTYIFRGNDGVKEFMPQVRELSDKILKEKIT